MSIELQQLSEMAQTTQEGLQILQKSFTTLMDKLSTTPANGHPNASQVFGNPYARVGEDPLTSRGFSFMKMLGLVSGAVEPEQAKVEMDIHNRMHNCLVRDQGAMGYSYGGGGQIGVRGGKFLAPLATSFLHEQYVERPFRQEMKALVNAGVGGADPDEMGWIRQKSLEGQYGQKTLSWLNEFLGGSLVQPAQQGELIELLRNKEALVNCGARVVPLPPQGRIKYPRQTAASSAYWVGENAPIPPTDLGVGEVTLQAKKLAVLIKAPNELLRFASPAAEALMRDDMTKTLALNLDLAGLEGSGTDTRPRGLLNYPNIYRLTSSYTTVDGDGVRGQDIYRMIAAVEEQNSEFETFLMRPKTLYKYYQLRADAVAQGDSQGPFLFNLIREAGDGVKPALAGYKVITSTQVSQVQTKGAGTGLTYVAGGLWSDFLIGMFGAIEFASTTLGDTAFTNDQTWVRGILSADMNIRHEASFVILQQLNLSL